VDFINTCRIARKIALALILSSIALAVFDTNTAGYAQDRNRGERGVRDGGDREMRGGALGTGIGIGIGIGEAIRSDVQPNYCYTREFGKVVTCNKRTVGGATCAGKCILSGDGTVIGPSPPSHVMADGVSYLCSCGQ
jgi:hypothetical protein